MNVQSIVTRQDRKTLAISITRDGKVIVKAPLSMPLAEIQRFVNQKQDWIDDKLNTINHCLVENADIIAYEAFLFLGFRHKPYWANVDAAIFDNQNRLLIPKQLPAGEALKAVARTYRKDAKRILTQRVLTIAETMNLEPKTIRMSNARSRWGSCSGGRVLSFNWRLVMLPTRLIDYVIVHELAHIVHMNHSDKFWRLVQAYISDCGILRKDLRGYSFILNLFR